MSLNVLVSTWPLMSTKGLCGFIHSIFCFTFLLNNVHIADVSVVGFGLEFVHLWDSLCCRNWDLLVYCDVFHELWATNGVYCFQSLILSRSHTQMICTLHICNFYYQKLQMNKKTFIWRGQTVWAWVIWLNLWLYCFKVLFIRHPLLHHA